MAYFTYFAKITCKNNQFNKLRTSPATLCSASSAIKVNFENCTIESVLLDCVLQSKQQTSLTLKSHILKNISTKKVVIQNNL